MDQIKITGAEYKLCLIESASPLSVQQAKAKHAGLVMCKFSAESEWYETI